LNPINLGAATDREELSLLGGAITGIAARSEHSTELPLIVYVPGGGSSVRAMDMPGRSHLAAAAANGFPAFALNRPGQLDSAPLELDPRADSGAFAANAERLEEAIAELWAARGGDAAGVVLHGCSIGGAVALHLAAAWSDGERRWPLLGLSVSDIGQAPPQEVVSAWRGLPEVETVDLLDHLGELRAAAPWTRPQGAPAASAPSMPIPRAELQEVVGSWPREWESVCRAISVPVHYRLAEHDTLWEVSEELVESFAAALRCSSPYVDAGICQGAAHNLSANVVGPSYVLEVVAFAHRCLAFEQVPRLLG
jgi:pimeloyl-ACP methyl ester carboxylesterase